MRPVQLVRDPRVTLQDEVNAPETAIKVASVQLAAPGQLEWTGGAGSCHQIGLLLPVWLDVALMPVVLECTCRSAPRGVLGSVGACTKYFLSSVLGL